MSENPQQFANRALSCVLQGQDDPTTATTLLLDLTKELSVLPGERRVPIVRFLHDFEPLTTAVIRRIFSPEGGSSTCAVTAWLHAMFKTGRSDEMIFCLNFVPDLVWAHLYRFSLGEKPPGIIALLLTIYLKEKELHESSPPDGISKALSKSPDVPVPDLSQGSVFHKAHDRSGITFAKLSSLSEKAEVRASPYPEIQSISSSTSEILVRTNIALYVSQLNLMTLTSQYHFLQLVHRLCSSGSWIAQHLPDQFAPMFKQFKWHFLPESEKTNRKFTLSTELLQEMFRGVSYCLSVQESRELAAEILKTIHDRATEDLIPEVMLSTTCLLSEVRSN
eukprot:TRINITY_DN11326_c0_g1_i2.p2 TRINITY_DN11326_c0_g1~~TRINITY_DN11326_c0_g1_i2.p2  ORF type:complete len:335 (-),score=78.49 TRINITY_DN11326_c0_g1_i2:2467-3471(-)